MSKPVDQTSSSRPRGSLVVVTLAAVVVVIAAALLWSLADDGGSSRSSQLHRGDADAEVSAVAAAAVAGPEVAQAQAQAVRGDVDAPVGDGGLIAIERGRRFRIPEGGFDKWTGREGTFPNKVELDAREDGTSVELALELRRLHSLTAISLDFKRLRELRDGQPADATLESELTALSKRAWSAGLLIYDEVRAGKRSTSDALGELRRLEDSYRDSYLRTARISRVAMDDFFLPGTELP